MIGLIRAHDLDRWGSRIVSPPEFPRLVRRLIHATGGALKIVDFPADEAIRLAGWDGKVLADEGTPYVPAGFSVWELGTGGDPESKADEDYEKRTGNPIGVDTQQATFVFVTPRNWPGKNAWAAKRRAEGKWKDVHALDSENLAQWLESAAGVAAWLGPIVGVVPPDAHGLEAECEAYMAATTLAFDLAGLLIGRDEQTTQLIALLQGPPAAIEISATTTTEGAAFVGACIQTLTEEQSEAMFARTVWVDSTAGLRHLAASDRPLIVIASGDLQSSPIRHHRIVVRTSRGSSSSVVELGAQPITPLVEHLAKLGMDRNEAFERCQEAGGYLERVRHTLLRVEPPLPAWASPPACVAVAASILIGEWDDGNEADMAVVAAIGGVGYEEFVRALTPYQAGPSPLVSHAGTVWKVFARPTAWKHLERSLTTRQLEAFLQAACDVLLEDDPRFELAPEERWMANVHDKRRAHSEHLRTGLVGGLVHSAVLGRDDSACYAGRRAQTWIDGACRGIFGRRRDAGFWRRIRGELMQLAEASPDQFLSGLEADLSEAQPQVCDLFEDEGTHGGCLHCDLLRALELLTWSPDFVGNAAMALAALAERDPGGRYANRPGRSLAEILHPADPQCTLTTSERKTLFASITQRHAKAGWNLGKALMPTSAMITTPIARPELRDWVPGQRKPMLLVDYWAEIQDIAERLLELAGNDVERWEFLLANLKALQPDLMGRVLQGAETFACELRGDERLGFWTRLRTLLHHHNQFSGEEKVDWVYPRSILDRLEALYGSLTPADPIARLAWLFSYQIGRPTNVARDWKEEEKRVDADMAAAVEELADLDLSTLIAALPRFQNHRLLGYWIGRSPHAANVERPLLSQCANSADAHEQEFGRGFAAARHELAPQEFLQRWCMSHSPDFLSQRGTARVVQALMPSPQIWDLVEAAGPECRDAYWKEAPIHLFHRPREAELAARNLLAAGRALDAIDLLASNVKSEWLTGEGDVHLVVEALKAGIGEANANPAQAQRGAYHIAQILKAVADSNRLQPGELIHLEWIYFGVLEYQAQHQLAIYEHLISDPVLLLQLVELIYIPEGTQKEDRPEPSEAQKSAANQAWRILHQWEPFNAVSPQAMPKPESLAATIESIRALAAEKRQRRTVDDLLGKALASSPVGVDGLWPHESVREVLERYGGDEEIADGFVVGRCNLRGTTSRRPGDGGEQERDLAGSYGSWQRAMAVSHPRTSRLLGRLAERYRSDANWQDVHVRTW